MEIIRRVQSMQETAMKSARIHPASQISDVPFWTAPWIYSCLGNSLWYKLYTYTSESSYSSYRKIEFGKKCAFFTIMHFYHKHDDFLNVLCANEFSKKSWLLWTNLWFFRKVCVHCRCDRNEHEATANQTGSVYERLGIKPPGTWIACFISYKLANV